jgi:hypothetical protein
MYQNLGQKEWGFHSETMTYKWNIMGFSEEDSEFVK